MQCLARGAFIGRPPSSPSGERDKSVSSSLDMEREPVMMMGIQCYLQWNCNAPARTSVWIPYLCPHWRFSRGIKLTSVHGPPQRCPRSGEVGGASQHFWALGRAGTRSGADNLTRDARRCLPVETLPPKCLT
ncbi:hypothetical protein CABS01_04485 [Colletotrichum abscissum]|uniref:uncharacterized protein n=1 Tax=Colletotrichum abscissum TaxID=1671311 RepID=UPI0027D5C326|nr:uncharacterized protein CABS01_04485 [Colletotrichum abscissum]KAK1473823.1 hypothetical protein CABS01_04485 [Colletotrichum abscissum]